MSSSTDAAGPVVMTTSQARAAGISGTVLGGSRWRSSWRGVHAPASIDGGSTAQRIAEAAALLPRDAAIGGWAAAWSWGAHEFDGRGASGGEQQPVPLVVPPPRRIRTRPGLLLIRSELDAADVHRHDGVHVTAPPRTAFDCARLSSVTEAVVGLDALARAGLVTLDDVDREVERHPGWRGIATVRRALDLADPSARSTGESRLRVLWLLAAQLPRPLVNVAVRLTAGHLLGIVDLLDPEAGLVAEYDGADHRSEAAHADDNAREEWLEDAGLVVVRVTARDLRQDHVRTRHRLTSAWRRGMARDRDRDRWLWTRP